MRIDGQNAREITRRRADAEGGRSKGDATVHGPIHRAGVAFYAGETAGDAATIANSTLGSQSVLRYLDR